MPRKKPYFDTEEFDKDIVGLALISPELAEGARWNLSSKWSENLVGRGGFPTQKQARSLAKFVLGELSIDALKEELRADLHLMQRAD